MVVIKKIKLNLVEKYLNNVVASCSQIKVSQEELRYVKSKMEKDKNDLLSGYISKSLFDNKKSSLEKEERKLKGKIKLNIKGSIEGLKKLRKILNEIEI